MDSATNDLPFSVGDRVKLNLAKYSYVKEDRFGTVVQVDEVIYSCMPNAGPFAVQWDSTGKYGCLNEDDIIKVD